MCWLKKHDCSVIRNIEIASREFSPSPSSSPLRPSTAPSAGDRSRLTKTPLRQRRRRRRPRSPSHPNYKEENYLLTHVRLQYIGHGVVGAVDDQPPGERRPRSQRKRRRRVPPTPSHVDEVTIVQQPRGSYVLEVFHGFLRVGGK